MHWKFTLMIICRRIGAQTQSNLGNSLIGLGESSHGIDGTTRLQDAVDAFHNALQVFTRERLPQDWALTQNNLGSRAQ